MSQSVETIKQKELFRRFLSGAEFEVRQEEGKKQKTMRFPASSEMPVDRWYGSEVLSHENGAVRMERANNGAMPLLFNHDVNDPIGMVTGAELKGGRMMVDAVMFDTPRAAEIQTMIDGGLRNVSLAYRVNVIEEDKKSETFTVTDWEPYEVSIVTVPADPSVGIGRGVESEYEVRMIRSQPADNATTRRATMADEKSAVADKTAEVEQKAKELNGVDIEKRRIEAIRNICKMGKVDERTENMYVSQGWSPEEASSDVLKIMEERSKHNPQSVAKIGLSGKDAKNFSLVRAINACSTENWTSAPFEAECSREVAKNLGKPADPRKFYVPFEVLQRDLTDEQRVAIMARGRRDLTVASVGGGGYLVGTDNMGFIELVRNRSVSFRMGARRMSGLRDSITIPRMSAAGTAYWINSEAQGATESQQTFQQVTLSPKTVGAYTEISRLLLLQSSPGAEGIVTDDLAQIVAIAADSAVLNGSGSSGQPTGILNAGIGSVSGGSLNYDAVLECQNDLATANVMPAAGGYVTTPTVAKYAISRQRFTSTDTPLWVGNIWDGSMSGFPAMSSNQVPSATLIFGDWQEVVVGEWGVLEVEVNPYANFQAGIVGVRCMYSMDVAVRRPFAFTAMATIS